MSYQMYRRTTLGNTLQESLDEMLKHKLIEQRTVSKKFDQCIANALSKKVKTRLTLRGHLDTYRFCDNVWTLVMKDVEIKDASSMLAVPKIKIVACEGKNVKPNSDSTGLNNKSIVTTTTPDKPASVDAGKSCKLDEDDVVRSDGDLD